jgi:hypothetical protein
MPADPPKTRFQFRLHHLIFVMLLVAVAAATVRNSMAHSPTHTAFDWLMMAAFLVALPFWIVSIRRHWRARARNADDPRDSQTD